MHDLLAELLSLAPSDLPVLSLYMDTRPAEAGRSGGRRHRGALVWLRHRLHEVEASVGVRGPARESIDQDVARIERYVQEELQPSTQGLALFACHGSGLFRAHQYQLPFDNELTVDKLPHVYPLARLLDGHKSYAAVLVDSENARIYTVAMGRAHETVRLHHKIEKPEKSGRAPGGGGTFGSTRLRYQRYLEGQVQHHLKGVVEHLDHLVAHEKLDHVIVGGSETISAELVRMLPKHLHERLLDRVHMDADTSDNEVLRTTMKILEERLSEERTRKVEWLLQQDVAEGMGVIGLGRTLRAINDGNTDEIIFAAGFNVTGFVCAACDQLLDYADQNGACRYCGGSLREVRDLREAMAARASRLGARITVVESHPLLNGPGGVAAVLRYRFSHA